MINCTAKAVKRSVTAVTLSDARWISDWTMRAPSSHSAIGSVIDVRCVMIAIASKPPNTAKPSMQLRCARASRCMNGDRLALSGTNWLAGTLPVMTCTVRTASIRTSSASVQATKPVKATTEAVIVSPCGLFVRPWRGVWETPCGTASLHWGDAGDGVPRSPCLRATNMDRNSVKWWGPIPAIVTPFDDRGAIDEKLLASNIDILMSKGSTGIVIGGCTGEFWALSMDERIALFKMGAKAMAGRGFV